MSTLNITSFDCLSHPENRNEYLNCEKYPDYASNILLELWINENNTPIIKMIYNGKEMRLCEGNYHCGYEDFKFRIKDYLNFDYKSVCKRKDHVLNSNKRRSQVFELL